MAEATDTQTDPKGPPQKKMFCVYADDEVKIQEIQAAFTLNRSDIMRRGLHMLHDYLINDKLPDGQSRSVVEGHDSAPDPEDDEVGGPVD